MEELMREVGSVRIIFFKMQTFNGERKVNGYVWI
jgi:hypothetical protein